MKNRVIVQACVNARTFVIRINFHLFMNSAQILGTYLDSNNILISGSVQFMVLQKIRTNITHVRSPNALKMEKLCNKKLLYGSELLSIFNSDTFKSEVGHLLSELSRN